MGETESEQFQSDFEIEVSDLDEPESAAGSPQAPPPARKQRFSPRPRRLVLLLLNGLLVLTVALLLASTTSVRGLVGGLFFHPTPTPTPTLVPGADLFYVAADPPWGQLLVDGHPAPFPLSAPGIGPPLRFTRGEHQLVWQAAPFLAQRCTVSVPPDVSDTCRDRNTAQTPSGLSAWVISFSESLANLAGTSQATLLQAAQAALDARQSTDIVRPGEHYVLAPSDPTCNNNGAQGYQCYATATQPLRATLSFQLDMNEASSERCIDPQPGNCTLNYQDCRFFCGSWFPAPSPVREWDVFAPVLPLWTISTMDGQVLERAVPDDSAQDYATGQTLDESLAPLLITWDRQGWHVSMALTTNGQGPSDSGYFNPVCAAMTQQVQILKPPAINGVDVDLQWQFASGSLPAAGCLATGTPRPANPLITPTPSQTQQPLFFYLHRFGVLLAVDRLAQSAGVLLPLADTYEQQLARGLSQGSPTQPGG